MNDGIHPCPRSLLANFLVWLSPFRFGGTFPRCRKCGQRHRWDFYYECCQGWIQPGNSPTEP